MSFTEAKLEESFIEMLSNQGYMYSPGPTLGLEQGEVIITDDLREYLSNRYRDENITDDEITRIIRELKSLDSLDIYGSNKRFMKIVSDGLILKRDNLYDKDLLIQLLDYDILVPFNDPDPNVLTKVQDTDKQDDSYQYDTFNIYRTVNQLEITGREKRIPDVILYINGLPLIVIEFKSAIRENCTIYDAWKQLTIRYKRDIPELFKYNAFCVISDGVNNKAGSLFAPYDFFYGWRRIQGLSTDVEGIDSLYTLVIGMFDRYRLLNIVRNFIFFPDSSKQDLKILCRYPQYYAAVKLFDNIKKAQRPDGDGKGGTYFGATGSGKSFTMLFLTRLLMRSKWFANPTIILITDRTDLDDQLSAQFTDAKSFIGDNYVKSVESRNELRTELENRQSGGVFLSTIHKFTEDTRLLSKRSNIICISDEAHRSQTNLEQKVKITSEGVQKTFGFAKYLRDSLPNATYVGFTGTPIDATIDVFGEVIDEYTMRESVDDGITVPIIYEGRAAKVALNNSELQKVEEYYQQCADLGTNEYQIEESKRAVANMNVILGDPDRLKAVASDFVRHYEDRVNEGASLIGKAMFVCSSRDIAWNLYKEIVELRPEWKVSKRAEDESLLDKHELKKLMPIGKIKMVMTRDKDDETELYDMLGSSDYRKKLDVQFKNTNSNFKIAIVVDMWLTGFDVPHLDTMYIDKPIQQHNLIQTISRVNRKVEGKPNGLVVDYIGIKKQMNKALAQFGAESSGSVKDAEDAVVIVKDHLDLLERMFHKFDTSPYFDGSPLQQLHTLNMAAEFVMATQKMERHFMEYVKRMKLAFDICTGSDKISREKRNRIHFYIAVRSIVFKLNKSDAPDISQMNKRVREMISDALSSDGVEEILRMGDQKQTDIFSDDYLNKIEKIKLPNTKVKLLQQLLAKSITEFKKTNRLKGIDFSKKMQELVAKYNERNEADVLRSEVVDDFADEIIDLYKAIRKERESFKDLGIDFEEKSFYDILKTLAEKYDFTYPEEKLIHLAKLVKEVVDDKARYTDWDKREDIKAELKVDLIILLAENDYPPVDRDEVYKEIFEQAENFKRYQKR